MESINFELKGTPVILSRKLLLEKNHNDHGILNTIRDESLLECSEGFSNFQMFYGELNLAGTSLFLAGISLFPNL